MAKLCGMQTKLAAKMWAAAVVVLVGLGLSSPALCQQRAGFDVQTFRPAVSPYSIFTVQTSPVLGHLESTGAVVLHYASDPLVAEGVDGQEDIGIVDQQLAMDIMAGVGLFGRLEIDASIPVYFVNHSDIADTAVQGGTVGDLAVRPKVAIIGRSSSPVGLSAAVDVTFPTGREQAFVGSPGVSAAPQLIGDYRLANVVFAANVGVRVLEDTAIRNVRVGDRLEYGAGAEARLLDGLLRVGGELYGHTELTDVWADADESPLEGIIGARVVSRSGVSVMAGGGAGLVGGVGAPEFRCFVGVRYSWVKTDDDDDGLRNAADNCPGEPEDLDGFDDADGCPDRDNDHDSVPDLEDRCAQQPGSPDNDGCPAKSHDDMPAGPPQSNDQQSNDQQSNGQPSNDQQSDTQESLPAADQRVNPGPDADGDGLDDGQDRCPKTPEDQDGFDDADGCPDVDNDSDGILDVDDDCPGEPGMENGHGCPAASGTGSPKTSPAETGSAKSESSESSEPGLPK